MRIIRRRFVFSGVFLLALALIIAGSFLFFGKNIRSAGATSEFGKLITVHDLGESRSFLSEANTVEDALLGAGYSLDDRDAVEPARSETLVASEYKVNIYRARPVTIVDGLSRKRVMTPYQTVERIASDADLEIHPEDRAELTQSDDLLSAGAGLQLSIDRATEFAFELYGKETVARTQATTVGDMLKDKGIELGDKDRVSPDASTAIESGLRVRVWREGVQTITVDEEVDFEVEKIQDADRPIGFREVRTPGVKGERTVTYQVTIENGQEVSRKEIASVTTKPSSKQVEVVGAKNNYSSTLNEWLLALRTCETNSRYNANTGNDFYGAYQFMIPTWNSIARLSGRPDLVGVRPDLASPADQDAMVIANANATAGLSTQHPGCYKKLGLSNKPPSQ